MYNLIVSANDEAWEKSPYSLDVARLGEYTAEALRTRYQKLTTDVITELQSFPTLFAYEHAVKKAARLGRVTRIAQPSGRDLRFHFTLYDHVPPIPYERVADLTWELDIGEWEINRTHWAVKDVDLLDVLKRAGLLTDAQTPAEFVDAASPTPPSAVNLPVRPTVFAIPPGDPQGDLVAVMMPLAPTFDAVYAAIGDACRTANLTCRRADEIWEESAVIQDVFSLIYRSRIVVADLTGTNPNVLYEVGIAHTLGRDVVPIAQTGTARPFDIAHHRMLDYRPDVLGLAAMQKQLVVRLRHLTRQPVIPKVAPPARALPPSAVPPAAPPSVPLSDDARELLLAAADDAQGSVMKLEVMGGIAIRTSLRALAEPGNTRQAARWTAAIRDLQKLTLIEDRHGKDEVFHVTHAGFELADKLRSVKK